MIIWPSLLSGDRISKAERKTILTARESFFYDKHSHWNAEHILHGLEIIMLVPFLIVFWCPHRSDVMFRRQRENVCLMRPRSLNFTVAVTSSMRHNTLRPSGSNLCWIVLYSYPFSVPHHSHIVHHVWWNVTSWVYHTLWWHDLSLMFLTLEMWTVLVEYVVSCFDTTQEVSRPTELALSTFFNITKLVHCAYDHWDSFFIQDIISHVSLEWVPSTVLTLLTCIRHDGLQIRSIFLAAHHISRFAGMCSVYCFMALR